MDLVRYGAAAAFRGLRQGNAVLSVGGFVLALVGWARGRSNRRQLLKRVVLKPGQQVVIRVAGKDDPPIRVPNL